MKEKIFYEIITEDRDDITIRTDDGGIATIHHNEEHFVTTYYQDRICTDCEIDWEELAEGKVHHKDWNKPHKKSIDKEMINDALNWLVVGDYEFIESKKSLEQIDN